MTQRVLHIGKFFPPHRGGMETFLSDLVQTQRAQGMDSHVLVHGQALADDPPWVRRVPVQAQLIYAPIALGFRAELARAIREIRPQVLHLHLPNNAVFWALTLASARTIPWVVHWHSDVLVSNERLALRCLKRWPTPSPASSASCLAPGPGTTGPAAPSAGAMGAARSTGIAFPVLNRCLRAQHRGTLPYVPV